VACLRKRLWRRVASAFLMARFVISVEVIESAFCLTDSRANLVAASAPGLHSHQAGCPLGKRADSLRVELKGFFQPDVFCRTQHVNRMRLFKVVLQYLLSAVPIA
jgi:hypothetical protein